MSQRFQHQNSRTERHGRTNRAFHPSSQLEPPASYTTADQIHRLNASARRHLHDRSTHTHAGHQLSPALSQSSGTSTPGRSEVVRPHGASHYMTATPDISIARLDLLRYRPVPADIYQNTEHLISSPETSSNSNGGDHTADPESSSSSSSGSPPPSSAEEAVLEQPADNHSQCDRFEYDKEERYAIMYLRLVGNMKWDEVVHAFGILFPVGELRRCPEPRVPDYYTQRDAGGFRCRYYRLRKTEWGISPVRDPKRNIKTDLVVIERKSSEMTPGFLHMLYAII